jgi:hypothetical protein
MADDEGPLARTDELRQYFAIAGILDGLTATPGVQNVFERWDTQLGISAKAHRLAEAHRARTARGPSAPAAAPSTTTWPGPPR